MTPAPRIVPYHRSATTWFCYVILLGALLGSLSGCDFLTMMAPTESGDESDDDGPYVALEVDSVVWNADFTRVDITYEAEDCEGGGEDTCDIDAVTLICEPGAAGTIESCDVSN